VKYICVFHIVCATGALLKQVLYKVSPPAVIYIFSIASNSPFTRGKALLPQGSLPPYLLSLQAVNLEDVKKGVNYFTKGGTNGTTNK
jgi:hypothetical protein